MFPDEDAAPLVDELVDGGVSALSSGDEHASDHASTNVRRRAMVIIVPLAWPCGPITSERVTRHA